MGIQQCDSHWFVKVFCARFTSVSRSKCSAFCTAVWNWHFYISCIKSAWEIAKSRVFIHPFRQFSENCLEDLSANGGLCRTESSLHCVGGNLTACFTQRFLALSSRHCSKLGKELYKFQVVVTFWDEGLCERRDTGRERTKGTFQNNALFNLLVVTWMSVVLLFFYSLQYNNFAYT